MTEEQFKEFIDEIIPQQLFHVGFKDKDDDTGAKLDEVILVRLLSNNLEALNHKPLSWFLENFIWEKEPEELSLQREGIKTDFEKREWNYSFEQGMVVRFADDLPEGTQIWDGGTPLYYYPKDYMDKLAIVIECFCDLHSFGRGSYYTCRVLFTQI